MEARGVVLIVALSSRNCGLAAYQGFRDQGFGVQV
jgi:hypothetical protein